MGRSTKTRTCRTPSGWTGRSALVTLTPTFSHGQCFSQPKVSPTLCGNEPLLPDECDPELVGLTLESGDQRSDGEQAGELISSEKGEPPATAASTAESLDEAIFADATIFGGISMGILGGHLLATVQHSFNQPFGWESFSPTVYLKEQNAILYSVCSCDGGVWSYTSWRNSVHRMVPETTSSGQPAHEQVDDEVSSLDTQPTHELVAMDVREQPHPWWSAGGTVVTGSITIMGLVSHDNSDSILFMAIRHMGRWKAEPFGHSSLRVCQ